jgi:hypothetical protein
MPSIWSETIFATPRDPLFNASSASGPTEVSATRSASQSEDSEPTQTPARRNGEIHPRCRMMMARIARSSANYGSSGCLKSVAWATKTRWRWVFGTPRWAAAVESCGVSTCWMCVTRGRGRFCCLKGQKEPDRPNCTGFRFFIPCLLSVQCGGYISAIPTLFDTNNVLLESSVRWDMN